MTADLPAVLNASDTVWSDSPTLETVRTHLVDARVQRLFAVACARRCWDQQSEESHTAILVAERYADGLATDEELLAADRAAYRAAYRAANWAAYRAADRAAYRAAYWAADWAAYRVANWAAYRAADWAAYRVANWAADWAAYWAAERRHQSLLFAGIVGTGWGCDPQWRTSTAVSLAHQMYESRDFSAMPILADALMDAGCENADWLERMADRNRPWCRGAKVIDTLIGKR